MLESDAPGLLLEPWLSLSLHLGEARQLAAPSASPVQSQLAGGGAPERKNTQRLKVHVGAISARYLSLERKNRTGMASSLALRRKQVPAGEPVGF